jgi:hypothetical protein
MIGILILINSTSRKATLTTEMALFTQQSRHVTESDHAYRFRNVDVHVQDLDLKGEVDSGIAREASILPEIENTNTHYFAPLTHSTLPTDLQDDAMAEPYPKRRKTSAPSTQTKRTTHHFDKNDCFTLVVGPDSNEILVHANYLVQESDFFKRMLTHQWYVSTIAIPDVDYETMTNYLTYAYIHKFPTSRLVGPMCDTFTGDEYLSLARLYFVGECFENQALKNATLAEMKRVSTLVDIDAETTFPGPEDIDVIYKGTSEGDPARRLMVDMIAENGSGQWLTPECNQSFILDLARKLPNKGREPFQLPPRRV